MQKNASSHANQKYNYISIFIKFLLQICDVITINHYNLINYYMKTIFPMYASIITQNLRYYSEYLQLALMLLLCTGKAIFKSLSLFRSNPASPICSELPLGPKGILFIESHPLWDSPTLYIHLNLGFSSAPIKVNGKINQREQDQAPTRVSFKKWKLV